MFKSVKVLWLAAGGRKELFIIPLFSHESNAWLSEHRGSKHDSSSEEGLPDNRSCNFLLVWATVVATSSFISFLHLVRLF